MAGEFATVQQLFDLASYDYLAAAEAAPCATSAEFSIDIQLHRWDAATLEPKPQVSVGLVGDDPIDADNEIWAIAIVEPGNFDVPLPPQERIHAALEASD